MQDDDLIESVAVAFSASKNRSYRERAIARARALIQFLQQNGLTRRPLLAAGESPGESTEVWRSDLTEEGSRVIEIGHAKWMASLDGGTPPEDTIILTNALNRVRGGKEETPQARGRSSAKRVERRLGKQPETGSQTKRHRKGCYPLDFELKVELIREYEASGPHVYDKSEWHIESLPDELGIRDKSGG